MPNAATYRKALACASDILSNFFLNYDVEIDSGDFIALQAAVTDIVWASMLIAGGLDPDDFPF